MSHPNEPVRVDRTLLRELVRRRITALCVALLLGACAAEGDDGRGMTAALPPTFSSTPNVADPVPAPSAPPSSASPVVPSEMPTAGSDGAGVPGSDAMAGAPAPAPTPATDQPGAPTAPPMPSEPPEPAEDCMPTGDPSELVMVGDSYLALTGEIARVLEMRTGRVYRKYYVSGTQLVGGFPPNIPAQYETAVLQGPIQTVIMDGGGNDVLLGDPTCRTVGPSACGPTVDAAVATLEQMLADMAEDGVRDVIYFFYPHLPNATLSSVVDFALPMVRGAVERCAPGLRCHFVDVIPAFEGHPEYISLDGIHPTNPGSAVIAELIHGVLESDGCIFR